MEFAYYQGMNSSVLPSFKLLWSYSGNFCVLGKTSQTVDRLLQGFSSFLFYFFTAMHSFEANDNRFTEDSKYFEHLI